MFDIAENKPIEKAKFVVDLVSKKILIAEDDDTNFFLIREYLTPTGATITWAKNGEEAVINATRNGNFDLILMDIQMPILSGLDAMKQIKRNKPAIPVVALTAYAMSGDREKGLNAGFDEYLSKPVTKRILLDTICRFVF
jgi:CheY-like chemotaxis protein